MTEEIIMPLKIQRSIKILAVLFIIFFIPGCKEENPFIQEMVYEQGPCYGVCPVYKLDITEGGLLRYIGIKFVSVTDTVFENLTGEQLAELTNAFHECGFFSLDDEYLNYSITDMPEYYTSVKIGGKIKSVRHYFGDYSAPEKLKNLYLNINEILSTKRWTGR